MSEPVQIGEILRMMQADADGNRTPDAKRAFADYLRANQTPSERMFARVLYHLGIQAEPQVMLRGYIVDFFDRTHGVVFEVDGDVHKGREAEDRVRDEAMADAGYRVVRISNDGVRNLMASLALARGAA